MKDYNPDLHPSVDITLSVSRPSELIKGLKFLGSKIRYEFTKLQEEDWTTYIYLIERTTQISEKENQGFQRANNSVVAFATGIYKLWYPKWTQRKQGLEPTKDRQSGTLKFENLNIFKNNIYSPRAYKSMKEQGFSIHLKRRKNRRRKTKFEYPYIGVGYSDKGNTVEESWDGTPGWKTIARVLSQLKNKSLSLNQHLRTDKPPELRTRTQRRSARNSISALGSMFERSLGNFVVMRNSARGDPICAEHERNRWYVLEYHLE